LLWRKDSWEELKLALNDLPSELLKVYDQIFEDIDGQGQLETAKILLKWLLYSERPLSLAELMEATMVNSQGTSFSIGRRAQDKSYVSLTLSSFITISQDNLVQFAHQTVQEYLISDKAQHGLFSRRVECHAWIARCCLSYTQFCTHSPDAEENTQQTVGDIFPLFEYVFNNWYRHFLEILANPREDENLVGEVLALSSVYPSGFSLSITGEIPDCEDPRRSLSKWATVANSWLDQIALCQDAPHFSILRDVACQGYERCIRFLFTQIAPTIPDRMSYEGFVLKAAVAGRYKEMIQILVHGVLKGGWNETSWWTATGYNEESQILEHESHEVIVQVLLNHGVNVNSVDSEDGWTALHTVAFQGDGKMMELLLSHGADPSATDYDGRTALHVASSVGHDAIVQLWLDKGLPINTKDNMGWKALDRALHRAAIEATVQHVSAAIRTTQGGLAHLESIQGSLDAESSGMLAMPQVLESNSKTLAQTISLLLNARVHDKEIYIETLQLIDDEPTESAVSYGVQLKARDEDNSTCFTGSSTADNRISFRGNISEIIVTGGHTKIGVSLMENLVSGQILASVYTSPPAELLQLRRRPRHFTMNSVKSAYIYEGTVDLIRCILGELVVYQGTANLTMCHVNSLQLLGGATNFLTPPRIKELVVERGTVVFQDCFPTASSQTANFTLLAPPKGQLKMPGDLVSFPPFVQLNELVLYGGSATFLAPANLKELVIYAGTVIFSSTVKLNDLVLYGGSVTFSKESHIKSVVMYRGFVNFLARAELSEMAIYGGCATFTADCRIADMAVYGGQINFFSAAEINQVMEYGGSVHFVHDIHREIFRIIHGIVNVEERVAETTTPAVRIQGLMMYGGFFNFCSRGQLEDLYNYGGFLNFNSDRVMCLLAGCGQVHMARVLLDQGVNPVEFWSGPRWLALDGGRKMEVPGWTALHEAAYRGHEAFVRMLLEKRVDVFTHDGNVPTALEIAMLQGHTMIVRLLEEVNVQAFERDSTMDGVQEVFQKYAQGICNAFRSLMG
jgi:ankyrin repeat protein